MKSVQTNKLLDLVRLQSFRLHQHTLSTNWLQISRADHESLHWVSMFQCLSWLRQLQKYKWQKTLIQGL